MRHNVIFSSGDPNTTGRVMLTEVRRESRAGSGMPDRLQPAPLEREISHHHHWERCKKKLQESIPLPFYHSFITPIRILEPGEIPPGERRETPFQLYVRDEKLRRHIEARYFPIIQDTLRTGGLQSNISLLCRADLSHDESAETTERKTAPDREPPNVRKQEVIFTPFHPHPRNRTDVELLRNLDFPESIVLVIGETGTGKTTLVREIMACESNREHSRHLSLEGFLTEFAQACRRGNVLKWRQDLRNNRLLIIDDFQFIKKTAEKSQEELRNLIEEFQQRGHRLLLCSDVPADRLPLQTALKSRLYLARTVTLLPPDINGRENILREEAARLQVPLGDEEIRHIARRIGGDGRMLRSAVQRLLHRRLYARTAEADSLDVLLQDLYITGGNVTPEKILAHTADFFHLSPQGIRGPARDSHTSLARHLTAYLCHEILDLKLSRIAEVIGRKEHGTVIHACNKVKALLEKDLFFGNQVEELILKIKSS